MIIHYLNHYGNVSANYTFNESDEFYNYHMPLQYLALSLGGMFSCSASSNGQNHYFNNNNNQFVFSSNSNETLNETALENIDVEFELSWWGILILLILVILLVIF